MRKTKGIFTVLLAFILLFSSIILSSCKDDAPKIKEEKKITTAKIDVLKVGKADCIVINTGTKIVMIDTAEKENVAYINSYMEKNGYKKIDTLILTHYDKDHIGGASEIISKYGVKTVVESKFVVNSIIYNEYHQVIYENGVDLIKLDSDLLLNYDRCEILVNVPKSESYKNMGNNSSLIISLTCGSKKLLFTADALEDRINEIIEQGGGEYDLVKLPHHGSYLANYESFLNVVNPKYAVITDSNKNPASNETISLLSEKGILAYQTQNGDVRITTNGIELKVTQ